MNDYCPICGGVTACPLNRFSDAMEVPEELKGHCHSNGAFCNQDVPCPGYEAGTHGHRTYLIDLPPSLSEEGWEVATVGSKATERMAAHFGVKGYWVSQCSYAYLVKKK